MRVGEEKIKICMVKMTGSNNHLIKEVTLAEKEPTGAEKGNP